MEQTSGYRSDGLEVVFTNGPSKWPQCVLGIG